MNLTSSLANLKVSFQVNVKTKMLAISKEEIDRKDLWWEGVSEGKKLVKEAVAGRRVCSSRTCTVGQKGPTQVINHLNVRLWL